MPDLFTDADQLAEHLAHLRLLTTDEGAPVGVVSRRTLEAVRALAEDRERLVAVRDAARRVRAAQRRYFRDRTNEALHESKELERKLDGMLKE